MTPSVMTFYGVDEISVGMVHTVSRISILRFFRQTTKTRFGENAEILAQAFVIVLSFGALITGWLGDTKTR